MLLSVDHCNYAIKTPFFSFVSGLSEHTSCPPLADELLEYDGRFWTLSGKRISYMRDKTQDNRFFILTLFAIARELVRTGSSSPLSQIDLAVGLPPEHYGVLKDRFANYFRRKDPIRFVYHDRPYDTLNSLCRKAVLERHGSAGTTRKSIRNPLFSRTWMGVISLLKGSICILNLQQMKSERRTRASMIYGILMQFFLFKMVMM